MNNKEMLDVVTNNDTVIGIASRKECHEKNLRHRGVHVMIFNDKGMLFVQKRSKKKDVFPGLYEGSLSGHVRAGETYREAAVRELKEELGITNHKLNEIGMFKLRARPEHEIIKIFMLRCDDKPKLSKAEVEKGNFVNYKKIKFRTRENPEQFTPSFLIALDTYEYATETKTH